MAQICRRLLAEGVRPCLYTDQANPVSNRVYERLGFVPIGDEGELVIR